MKLLSHDMSLRVFGGHAFSSESKFEQINEQLCELLQVTQGHLQKPMILQLGHSACSSLFISTAVLLLKSARIY